MSTESAAPTFAPLTAGGQSGFHGVMRRIGLQELLQLECLGRKSSVMEIMTPKVRGRIFISEGSIIHAESGTIDGEVALYGLLALRGGQFNLLPYSEPSKRTISGQWEFLLMEAARITDESSAQVTALESEMIAANEASESPGVAPGHPSAAPPAIPSRTEEIVLCSGSGELVFQLNCAFVDDRRALLSCLQEQAEELAAMAPIGAFDRLKISVADDRFLFQIRSDRRLMVRTSSCPDL